MTHPILPPSERFEELRVLGNPLETTEVRWFALGEPPPAFVEWFSSAGLCFLEIRRDVYRIDPDPDSGLKRRDDGPLELKRRLAVTEPRHFPGGFVGRAEEWSKTGLEEPETSNDWKWRAVDKVVLTRSFALCDRDDLCEVDGRDMDLPACDVELATITVDGEVAWSFALEAWGPADLRHRLLDDSLAALLAADPTPPDGFVDSLALNMGYPEWLASGTLAAR